MKINTDNDAEQKQHHHKKRVPRGTCYWIIPYSLITPHSMSYESVWCIPSSDRQ
jgi:hypothetical protein